MSDEAMSGSGLKGLSGGSPQEGSDQVSARHGDRPPAEGSNRGNGPTDQSRGNIDDTVSTGATDEDVGGLSPAEESVPEGHEIDGEDIAVEDDETPNSGASRGAADEQDTAFRRSI